MNILLAGGSGFLGTALRRALLADGHHVRVLTRRPRDEGDVAWSPSEGDSSWRQHLNESDVVINLAGESLAGRRWTADRKRTIRDSRVNATRALVAAIITAATPPKALLSSSAVGIYGSRGDETLTETSPLGSDFLADVGRAWEAEALHASTKTRVTLLRTGLVLARDGGALPQLALPFRLFAGGPVGTGRQYMSWIALEDWIRLVRWVISTDRVSGPVNFTAPSPVTNAEFGRVLGRVLHRPSLLPAPAFALRMLLGEMADALVLGGQRVIPARALELGYEFKHASLESALRWIYR